MTILVVAVVALALFVAVAAVISGFLWFTEHKLSKGNSPISPPAQDHDKAA